MNMDHAHLPTQPRSSPLLPLGATLSVLAALTEALSASDLTASALAAVGGIATLGAWALWLRRSGTARRLGARFLSIGAIAFAITGLIVVTRVGWAGWLGAIGLWIAAAGAGLEWWRAGSRDTSTTYG